MAQKSNFKANAFPAPSLELVQAATTFLETVNKLDPVHRREYLARLDHLIGFKGVSSSVQYPQLLSKKTLLDQAKAVGLTLAPWLVKKIMNDFTGF
ncbi:MAG TPA: hypothetical protein DCL61_00160 [Cyanobacteria bacterium UBA12227]|nr:hypothetical protein [Cyanobacteria bacterium UBA12227]HAX87477.1 hypothetical protein [Cyanobacteria bacterium UBA11370]HBY79804.1 hypothetical protein [Cyanobacteria bacterium UBA11148]